MQVISKYGVKVCVQDRLNDARSLLNKEYKKLFPARIKDSNLRVHTHDDVDYYMAISPIDGVTCLLWYDDGETSNGCITVGEIDKNSELYHNFS